MNPVDQTIADAALEEVFEPEHVFQMRPGVLWVRNVTREVDVIVYRNSPHIAEVHSVMRRFEPVEVYVPGAWHEYVKFIKHLLVHDGEDIACTCGSPTIMGERVSQLGWPFRCAETQRYLDYIDLPMFLEVQS